MNFKPFDLQAALRGEPVCDSEGTEVTQIAHFPTADRDSRVAVQWGPGGIVSTHTEDGRDFDGSGTFSLYMAPKKVTKWGRLLRDKVRFALYPYPCAYDTKELAEMDFVPQETELVTIFPIEFEE